MGTRREIEWGKDIQVHEPSEGKGVGRGATASNDTGEIMLGEAAVEALADANSESLGVGMMVAWRDYRLWVVEHVLAVMNRDRQTDDACRAYEWEE